VPHDGGGAGGSGPVSAARAGGGFRGWQWCGGGGRGQVA
jgi:hypothetical protein